MPAVLSLILIAGLIGEASAASIPEPAVAVQQLNDWRSRVGVAPVTEDPQQSANCRAHAEYYRLNKTMGHSQDPSLPGYTLEGHKGAATSMLFYSSSPTDVMGWEDAVYHRIGLLSPRLRTSGYWSEHGIACMGAWDRSGPRSAEFRSFAYPYDGQVDVATTFACNETPNPCDAFGSRSPIGFIPSLQFDGPGFDTPGVLWESIVAVMSLDGVGPIASTVDPQTGGPYTDGGVSILPHQPLQPTSWYTVSVSGVLRGDGSAPNTPFSRTWRFRTAAPPPPPSFTFPTTTAPTAPPQPSADLQVVRTYPKKKSRPSKPTKQALRTSVQNRKLTLKFGALRGRKARTATVSFWAKRKNVVRRTKVRAAGKKTFNIPARIQRITVTMNSTSQWMKTNVAIAVRTSR